MAIIFGILVPNDVWLNTMSGKMRTNIVLPDLYIWNRLVSVSESRFSEDKDKTNSLFFERDNENISLNNYQEFIYNLYVIYM